MASAGCKLGTCFGLVVEHHGAQNSRMTHSPELDAYFELCKEIYERMVREGSWPWTADSTNPEDVIDLQGNQHEL